MFFMCLFFIRYFLSREFQGNARRVEIYVSTRNPLRSIRRVNFFTVYHLLQRWQCRREIPPSNTEFFFFSSLATGELLLLFFFFRIIYRTRGTLLTAEQRPVPTGEFSRSIDSRGGYASHTRTYTRCATQPTRIFKF